MSDRTRLKICCLKGSPRRNGNTEALTDIVLSRMESAGCATETFRLYDMDLRPCLACRACQEDWSQVSCARPDDMQKIFDAVSDCDLLLISTPVYSWYCTPPVKAVLDRMVYAFNMYYGEKRGPSLWEGKQMALITTCGYPPEKGADLLEEGMRRYCRHSRLMFEGMLCERHLGYQTVFMDEDKKDRAEAFAETLISAMERRKKGET